LKLKLSELGIRQHISYLSQLLIP